MPKEKTTREQRERKAVEDELDRELEQRSRAVRQAGRSRLSRISRMTRKETTEDRGHAREGRCERPEEFAGASVH